MADPFLDPIDPSPLRRPPSALPVLAAGAITTALTLVAVFYLQRADIDPLGWYLDYIIPAGALVVGLVASLGFAAASWLTGAKISGRLMIGTLLILVLGYACAEFLRYRLALPDGVLADGTPLSFFSWYDSVTRSIAFAKDAQDGGGVGEPLGLLGYGVRALELLGFAGGGVIIPFALRKLPFCEPCNLYMRTAPLAVMRAGLRNKMFGNNSPERQAERAQLASQAKAGLAAIFEAGGKGPAELRAAVEANGPLTSKEAKKALPRVEVKLARCKGCSRGRLIAEQLTQAGNKVIRSRIGQRELEPNVVEGL